MGKRTKSCHKKNRVLWTAQEEHDLETNYPQHGSDLRWWLDSTDRSCAAVRSKASRMHIKYDPYR